MRLMVIEGTYRGRELTQDQVIENFKKKEYLKFVPLLRADVRNDELVLVISLGSLSDEHQNLFGIGHEVLRDEDLPDVSLKPTGGRVEMRGDELVFFDASNKYGPFDPELMRKVPEQQYLDIFGAKSVSFKPLV